MIQITPQMRILVALEPAAKALTVWLDSAKRHSDRIPSAAECSCSATGAARR